MLYIADCQLLSTDGIGISPFKSSRLQYPEVSEFAVASSQKHWLGRRQAGILGFPNASVGEGS